MRKEDSGVVMSQPCADGAPPVLKPGSEPSAVARPEGHCADDEAWLEFVRQYAGQPRSMGQYTDFELANRVYMAGRGDLDLIVWQTAAKERIRWLSIRLAEALTAAPASPGGWQPIESAPRDGTWVDLWADDQRWANHQWVTTYGGAWASRSWRRTHAVTVVRTDLKPTHWMPRPSPPSEAAGPRSRDVPQDDQIPTPKPVPILAREGQEGDQRSSGVPAEVAASTGVKSDNQEGH